MFLEDPPQTLDDVKHDSYSTVYASMGDEVLRCLECGDIGHKEYVCPHKQRQVVDGVGTAGG